MSLKSSEELTQIRWLGLGPYDAYPNKQSAPILGVWGGVAGSKDVTGNKATRWIERFGNQVEYGYPVLVIWNIGKLLQK